MEKSTDEELMSMILKKNTKALRILYNRYEVSIFNYILKYTGSRDIAQDLLQETFTRVWYAAHTFSQESGKFRGWLYTIALNNTRNEMVKKRYDFYYVDVTEIKGEQEPAHPQAEQPDVQLEHSDLKDTIAKALGKLKPHLREIIVLKQFQQLKFREIAEITKVPEGTLKARFHRAIAKLKPLLEAVEF